MKKQIKSELLLKPWLYMIMASMPLSGCYVQTSYVVREQPKPNITQAPAPVVTVTPAQPAPVVTVTPPQQQQPVPVVTVTPPQQQPVPVVTVTPPSHSDSHLVGPGGGEMVHTGPIYGPDGNEIPTTGFFGEFPEGSAFIPPQVESVCYSNFFGEEICEVHVRDDASESGRDLTSGIAAQTEVHLREVAQNYSNRFSLSEEKGYQLARTIHEFQMVETRSNQDMADFARRLYGIDPQQIITAVSRAQLGDQSRLNQLVSEAAQSFETSPVNMKNIVKELHGDILKDQGIRLD